MLAKMACSESANTSMRLKARRREAREVGKISSDGPPWEMMTLEDGTIPPNPESGPIARQVIDRVLAGSSNRYSTLWSTSQCWDLDPRANTIRFRPNANPEASLIRRIAMRGIASHASQVADVRLTDATSGFCCISQPLLREFSRSYPVQFMESYKSPIRARRAD